MAVTSTCKSGSLLPLTRTPALTTVWTPPDFCSTRFHAGAGSSPPYRYGWQDEVDPQWYSCMPPEWDSVACQSLTFSPALDCPHGWTVAASKSVLGPARSPITFATCCMSGFSAGLYWDGEKCVAPVVNFPLVVLATNASDGQYLTPLATSVSTATLEKGTIDHRALVIGWQLSDLPMSSSVPTPRPTLPSNSSPTGSITPSETGTTGNLSSGAIAGIAVGALAAVAIILAAIFVLWRKRMGMTEQPVGELDTSIRPELPSPLPSGEPKALSQPGGRYELGSGGPRDIEVVYEMSGR